MGMAKVTREYYIPLPIPYEMIYKGQQYVVGAMSQKETAGSEATIVVHENINLTKEYIDSSDNQLHKEKYEKYPESIYTRKEMKFGCKAPAVLTFLLPAKMFNAMEDSYVTFPRSETFYKSSYMDPKNHDFSVISNHENGLDSLLNNEECMKIAKRNE